VSPRRLLVMTPRELTRDVRARRQVEAAREAGLEVLGLSAVLRGETPLALPGIEVARVPGDRLSAPLRRLGLGGFRQSHPVLHELRGLWRLVRLGKTTIRLVRAARGLGRFDLVHVNDFDALPAGYLIARRSAAPLVYDAHELYRAAEAEPPRLWAAVVAGVEGWIGRRARAVVTNCDPFARELDTMLRLRRPATVVLNCPDPVPELPASAGPGGPLRVIYQAGGDHESRPVADLLVAAEHAPGAVITIRLVYVEREQLEVEIAARGLSGRVVVSDPVAPDRLVEGLTGYDVGVILNRDTIPNVALAVPGKLWEYMMAGLGTVAPALPGLALVDELGVGVTFPPGEPEELGRRLQALAEDREALAAMQAQARTLALERFNSVTQAAQLREVWQAA